ncbi:MAG: VOC family protein [Longimicrobiales bacterium]
MRLLVVAALIASSATQLQAQRPNGPPVLGLDHVPIAVNALDVAAARYRQLGFSLKPGRPHANGIQNQHVKFRDGTELELITAPAVRDSLTATYRRHLRAGDGPAFLALYAPASDRLVASLKAAGFRSSASGALVSLRDPDPLRYVFFGPRNQSPTDRPEHFAHANTGESLIAVWLAGADLSRERRLLTALGAGFEEQDVNAPQRMRATIARLPEGVIILLPAERQLVRDRPIVGATVRVRSLEAARKLLEAAQLPVPATVQLGNAVSIFLPPALTHGIWLELREVR